MTHPQSFRLGPHPSNPGAAISEILALVNRRGNRLDMSFRAIGDRAAVRWPMPMPTGFSDGLWQHSCFEAFVSAEGALSYVELNMAPSRQWAAYRFSAYRAGMRRASAALIRPVMWFGGAATLTVCWRMPDLPVDVPWAMNLCAVIETHDGDTNYFALAHAPGRPDFHNRDCFIAALPAPDAP